MIKKFLRETFSFLLGVFSLISINTNTEKIPNDRKILANGPITSNCFVEKLTKKTVKFKKVIKKKISTSKDGKSEEFIINRGGKSNKPRFVPILNEVDNNKYYDPNCWALVPYKEKNSFSKNLEDNILPSIEYNRNLYNVGSDESLHAKQLITQENNQQLLVIPKTEPFDKMYVRSWTRWAYLTRNAGPAPGPYIRRHASYKKWSKPVTAGLSDFYYLKNNIEPITMNARPLSLSKTNKRNYYISRYEKTKYNSNLHINPFVKFFPTYQSLRIHKAARVGGHPKNMVKLRYRFQHPSEHRYAIIEKFYYIKPNDYQRDRPSTTLLPRLYVKFVKKSMELERLYYKVTRPVRKLISPIYYKTRVGFRKGKSQIKIGGLKMLKWANEKKENWFYGEIQNREDLPIIEAIDVTDEYLPPYHEPVEISKIIHQKDSEGPFEEYFGTIFEMVDGSIENYLKIVCHKQDITWARDIYEFSKNQFPFMYRSGYCYEDELINLASHPDFEMAIEFFTIIPCYWMDDHVPGTGLLRLVNLGYRDPEKFISTSIPEFPGLNYYRLVTDKKDFLTSTNSIFTGNSYRINLKYIRQLFDSNGRYEYYCPAFEKGGLVIKPVKHRHLKLFWPKRDRKKIMIDPPKIADEFERPYKAGAEWGKYRLETRPIPLWTVLWDNSLYAKRQRERRIYNKLFRAHFTENHDSHNWGLLRETVDGRHIVRERRPHRLVKKKRSMWILHIEPSQRIHPFEPNLDSFRYSFRLDHGSRVRKKKCRRIIYLTKKKQWAKLDFFGRFKKRFNSWWERLKYKVMEFIKDMTIRRIYRSPRPRRKPKTTYMTLGGSVMPISRDVIMETKHLRPYVNQNFKIVKQKGFGKINEWRKVFYYDGLYQDQRLKEDYLTRPMFWGIPSLRPSLELCKKYSIAFRADQISMLRLEELSQDHNDILSKEDLIDEDFISFRTIPYNIDINVFNRRYINPKRDKNNLPLFGLHRDYGRKDDFNLLIHDYLKYGKLGIHNYSYNDKLETIFKHNRKFSFFYQTNFIRKNERDFKNINYSYPQLDNYGNVIHNYPYPQGDETSKRAFCYPCLYFDKDNNIVVEKKYYNWPLFYPYFYPKPDNPNLITPQEYWEKQSIWIKKYLDENEK